MDLDQTKIDKLNAGTSYIDHVPNEDIKDLLDDGKLVPTTEYVDLKACNSISICVPTPLNKNREPDLTYIQETAKNIASFIVKGQLIVLESTVHPGCTENELLSVLEKNSNMKAGIDFHLAFSPEREDPGNKSFALNDIPKIVGGLTKKCEEKATYIYSSIIKSVIPVSNCRTAEATKLTENIFRSVNIALVNELKVIYDKMDIDIWEVIDAAKTKPFGFMPFYPGPGLGGHCIPIDPFYLTWKAREYDMHTRFIELAGEINTSMPEYVLSNISDVLNNLKKSINGSKILILGVAYKANVDDHRESPTFPIMKRLKTMGAEVAYHDPHVPRIQKKRDFPEFEGLESSALSNEYDLFLILTAHDVFKELDYKQFNTPVIDTRNIATSILPDLYFKS